MASWRLDWVDEDWAGIWTHIWAGIWSHILAGIPAACRDFFRALKFFLFFFVFLSLDSRDRVPVRRVVALGQSALPRTTAAPPRSTSLSAPHHHPALASSKAAL